MSKQKSLSRLPEENGSITHPCWRPEPRSPRLPVKGLRHFIRPSSSTATTPAPASSGQESTLRGVDAILEKLPAVLPNRAPDNWQWIENRPAQVGLLMISTAAPFLAGYRKAFDIEAKRLNLEVIALDANNDPARQASQAEDLIGKRVDVLCFWPVDAKAIVPSVRKAYEAGIPLVCTNSWTEESVLHCFKSFVGASMVAGRRHRRAN